MSIKGGATVAMAKEGSEKTRTAKECLGWGWAVVWVGFTAQDTQMTKTD